MSEEKLKRSLGQHEMPKKLCGVGAFQTREFYARQGAIVDKIYHKNLNLRRDFAGKGPRPSFFDEIMTETTSKDKEQISNTDNAKTLTLKR